MNSAVSNRGAVERFLASLSPDGCERVRRRRKLDRTSLELFRRLHDQFGQTDCGEQTSCHPACKGLSDLRQHRQARPQRIARRRVRVVRQGVQEQIRETVARQMIGR